MTRPQIKFLVTVFSVLALWRVFEVPAVSNAFWAFCTAGAIPGTDYEMGADAVLRLLCITFAVAFFLIFRKEFMNSLPENFLRRQTPPVAPVSEPVAAPKAAHILLVINQQASRPRPVLIRPVIMTVAAAALWLVRATVQTEASCKRFMIAAGWLLHAGVMSLYEYVRPLALRLYRVIFVAVRFMMRLFVLGWRQARPYIKTFDQGLEAQLRANAYTNEIICFMDDTVRVSKDIGHKVHVTTRKLLADK